MLRQQREELNNLGLVRYDQQNYPAAKQYFNTSLAIARQINDKAAIAMGLNNLAMLAIDLKQFDDAEQFNHEALDLNRANHDHQSELYSLQNSAAIAQGRGDLKKAEALFSDVIRESTNDIWLRWMGQVGLANTYSAEKQTAAADREFRTALATIDQARAAVGKEEYRLSFLNTATLFYNSYIDFLVEHGRANDALRIVEHSRARTLAEGLGLNPFRSTRRRAPSRSRTVTAPSSSNTGSSRDSPISGQSRQTKSRSSNSLPTPRSMPPCRTTAKPCSARAIRSKPATPLAASFTTCWLRPRISSSAPARASSSSPTALLTT